MKLGTASLIAVFTVGALLIGCSNSTTVQDSEGNKVTVAKDGSSATVETADGETATMKQEGDQFVMESKDGKVTVNTDAEPSEAEVGIAFYPGSKHVDSGNMSFEGPEGKSRVVSRTTTDEPAKVVAFYKEKLKEPQSATMSTGDTDTQIVGGKVDDKTEVAITATRDKGELETKIQMTVVKKN